MAVGPLRSEYWREFPGRFSQRSGAGMQWIMETPGHVGVQQIEYSTCVDLDRNIL
jgi:hypothetical protein